MNFIIQKLGVIEDEAEQERLVEILAEKQEYYSDVFSKMHISPKIIVRYHKGRYYGVTLTYRDRGAPIIIEESGYGTAVSMTQHAFKKLRRIVRQQHNKSKIRK